LVITVYGSGSRTLFIYYVTVVPLVPVGLLVRFVVCRCATLYWTPHTHTPVRSPRSCHLWRTYFDLQHSPCCLFILLARLYCVYLFVVLDYIVTFLCTRTTIYLTLSLWLGCLRCCCVYVYIWRFVVRCGLLRTVTTVNSTFGCWFCVHIGYPIYAVPIAVTTPHCRLHSFITTRGCYVHILHCLLLRYIYFTHTFVHICDYIYITQLLLPFVTLPTFTVDYGYSLLHTPFIYYLYLYIWLPFIVTFIYIYSHCSCYHHTHLTLVIYAFTFYLHLRVYLHYRLYGWFVRFLCRHFCVLFTTVVYSHCLGIGSRLGCAITRCDTHLQTFCVWLPTFVPICVTFIVVGYTFTCSSYMQFYGSYCTLRLRTLLPLPFVFIVGYWLPIPITCYIVPYSWPDIVGWLFGYYLIVPSSTLYVPQLTVTLHFVYIYIYILYCYCTLDHIWLLRLLYSFLHWLHLFGCYVCLRYIVTHFGLHILGTTFVHSHCTFTLLFIYLRLLLFIYWLVSCYPFIYLIRCHCYSLVITIPYTLPLLLFYLDSYCHTRLLRYCYWVVRRTYHTFAVHCTLRGYGWPSLLLVRLLDLRFTFCTLHITLFVLVVRYYVTLLPPFIRCYTRLHRTVVPGYTRFFIYAFCVYIYVYVVPLPAFATHLRLPLFVCRCTHVDTLLRCTVRLFTILVVQLPTAVVVVTTCLQLLRTRWFARLHTLPHGLPHVATTLPHCLHTHLTHLGWFTHGWITHTRTLGYSSGWVTHTHTHVGWVPHTLPVTFTHVTAVGFTHALHGCTVPYIHTRFWVRLHFVRLRLVTRHIFGCYLRYILVVTFVTFGYVDIGHAHIFIWLLPYHVVHCWLPDCWLLHYCPDLYHTHILPHLPFHIR